MEFSVKCAYEPNSDKRAWKRDPHADQSKIFSMEHRNSICATAKQFGAFLKSEYSDVRIVKNITVDMVNAFLDSKAETCSTKTLKKYTSHIDKIALCVNANPHYGGRNVDWKEGRIVPESIKTPDEESVRDGKAFDRADYNKILEHGKSTRSEAWKAWELSARFGLRVEGCEKITANMVNLDVQGKYGFGQIELRYQDSRKGIEKGGRARVIDIRTSDDAAFIKSLCNGKAPSDRLIGLKRGTINNELNKAKIACKISNAYVYSGVHGIRKMWAQNLWNTNKVENMSYRENIRYCNNQLGHGDKRGIPGIKAYIISTSY